MSPKKSHLSLFTAVLLSATALGEDKLFPTTHLPGKEYHLQSNQSLSGLGTQQATKVEIRAKTVCTQVDKTHAARKVVASVSVLKMDLNLGPISMKYDSDDPELANSLLKPQVENVLNQPLTLWFDADGNEIEDESDGDRKGLITAADLRGLLLPGMNLGIPTEGASIGDEWTSSDAISLGASGKIDVVRQFTYTSDSDGLAVVQLSGDADAVEGSQLAGPIPLTVHGMQMTGEFRIDKALRHLRDGNLTMEMELGIEKNGETVKLPTSLQLTFMLLDVKDAVANDQ